MKREESATLTKELLLEKCWYSNRFSTLLTNYPQQQIREEQYLRAKFSSWDGGGEKSRAL